MTVCAVARERHGAMRGAMALGATALIAMVSGARCNGWLASEVPESAVPETCGITGNSKAGDRRVGRLWTVCVCERCRCIACNAR